MKASIANCSEGQSRIRIGLSFLSGFPAPGSYKQFSELSSIDEETGVPNAQEMVRQMVSGQEAVARTARKVAPLADKVSDEPTLDLLTQRMQVHEKNAWMLRSLLEA
ncbi:MAG: hypothetical protein DHS20C11_27250 [Lysobacteraceae bacterium]|nr:MAG: hypothetical protein DHS20C11_27250 [Xanthomonadaceae bacterium]